MKYHDFGTSIDLYDLEMITLPSTLQTHKKLCKSERSATCLISIGIIYIIYIHSNEKKKYH